MEFDAREYKKGTMDAWNEVAPRYHEKWAGRKIGPFRVTRALIAESGIKRGDRVLDVACGTGMVTREISSKVGADGSVVGVDISHEALRVARDTGRARNAEYVQADAETVFLKRRFDVVTCQYAIFFFPDAVGALCNARQMLKRHGRLAVAVHGIDVPYYRCILDAISGFIPDYISEASPDLRRFSTEESLGRVIGESGFSGIAIKRFVFGYSPGTFDEYWAGYLGYIAKRLRKKIDDLPPAKADLLRQAVKKNAEPYTGRDARIRFPWEVLIATARG